jgi:S-ribosylhomocysteine lyase LuxS involved in autoinducer biosynthesis
VASIQGLVVQTRELNDIEPNQIIELDIAGMRTGQYLVKVSNENGQKTLQMIKY